MVPKKSVIIPMISYSSSPQTLLSNMPHPVADLGNIWNINLHPRDMILSRIHCIWGGSISTSRSHMRKDKHGVPSMCGERSRKQGNPHT